MYEGSLSSLGIPILVTVGLGHNPHAVNYLAGVLKRLNYSKVNAVVGMLKDKDITATLSTISETVDYWYFASLPTERAATSEEINQLAIVHRKSLQLINTI